VVYVLSVGQLSLLSNASVLISVVEFSVSNVFYVLFGLDLSDDVETFCCILTAVSLFDLMVVSRWRSLTQLMQ